MPSPESPKPLILSKKEAYWLTLQERGDKKKARHDREAFLRNETNKKGLNSIKAIMHLGTPKPVVGEIETILPTVTLTTKEGKDIKQKVESWSTAADATVLEGLAVKRIDGENEEVIFRYQNVPTTQSEGEEIIACQLSIFKDGLPVEINNLKKIKSANKLMQAYTKAVLANQPPQK